MKKLSEKKENEKLLKMAKHFKIITELVMNYYFLKVSVFPFFAYVTSHFM